MKNAPRRSNVVPISVAAGSQTKKVRYADTSGSLFNVRWLTLHLIQLGSKHDRRCDRGGGPHHALERRRTADFASLRARLAHAVEHLEQMPIRALVLVERHRTRKGTSRLEPLVGLRPVGDDVVGELGKELAKARRVLEGG